MLEITTWYDTWKLISLHVMMRQTLHVGYTHNSKRELLSVIRIKGWTQGKPLLFVPVDFIRPALCVASFPGPFAATDLFFEHLYHKTASQHQSHRRLAHLCYCSQDAGPTSSPGGRHQAGAWSSTHRPAGPGSNYGPCRGWPGPCSSSMGSRQGCGP